MNARAFFVVSAMLVSPAWSQEPTFDLKSDSIKQIVRTTAATQYAPVQISEAKPVERESSAAVKWVPPVKEAPVERPVPRLPDPAPRANGFVDALFGILVEEVLDLPPDETLPEQPYTTALKCPSGNDVKANERYETCPGINRDGLEP